MSYRIAQTRKDGDQSLEAPSPSAALFSLAPASDLPITRLAFSVPPILCDLGSMAGLTTGPRYLCHLLLSAQQVLV